MININEVKRISGLDTECSIERKVLKINEEVGELTQISLAYIDSENASGSLSKLSHSEKRQMLLEEACDVLNSTMHLLFSEGFTDESIKCMFNHKLSKWESKL